jgi:hypothetical protein
MRSCLTVAWSILLLCFTSIAFAATATSDAAEARYISDLGIARPRDAVSPKNEPGKWRLLSYQTRDLCGKMLFAPSFVTAADVTLPLQARGWHAIYLGVWNPEFAYDGQPVVKARLSSDRAFRQLHIRGGADTQDATYLREIHLTTEDLTNQNLVIGKASGLLGQSCYVAYVKLVPISPERVKEIEASRAATDRRRLTATIDGSSYFHTSEYSKAEHILELVELYRHSDVGRVLWAVSYGDAVNYPAKVPDALFLGKEAPRGGLMTTAGFNENVRGERQMHESLRKFAERGIIPQQVAAKRAHELGVKFDVMLRLGIHGGVEGVGPIWSTEDSYTRKFPQYRQLLQDGAVLEKASFAFPAVRQFQLDLLRDAATQIDCDGVNLCFVRGPHYVAFEEPLLKAFQAKYHEDARKVAPTDPRLGRVRAEFITPLVRGARKVLDELGAKKGRKLDLSVWVWPTNDATWLGWTPPLEGLDVKGWINDGLVQSVICQCGIDREIMELAKRRHCKFVYFSGYRGPEAMCPRNVTKAYQRGVTEFAFWDMDQTQNYPEAWDWLRCIGSPAEMAAWVEKPNVYLRLKTINGVNVEKGMATSIYSGG